MPRGRWASVAARSSAGNNPGVGYDTGPDCGVAYGIDEAADHGRAGGTGGVDGFGIGGVCGIDNDIAVGNAMAKTLAVSVSLMLVLT